VLGQLTERFREAVKQFAERNRIPCMRSARRRKTTSPTGSKRQLGTRDVVFIGVAQEKARTLQAERSTDTSSSALQDGFVNHYYFYIDTTTSARCSSSVQLCAVGHQAVLNGHEWVKRQLELRIAGQRVLSCADPRPAAGDL
jgi:hypothetical protein